MGAYLCIASNGVPPSVSKRILLLVHCKYIENVSRHFKYCINGRMWQVSGQLIAISFLHVCLNVDSYSNDLDPESIGRRPRRPANDAGVQLRSISEVHQLLDERQHHYNERYVCTMIRKYFFCALNLWFLKNANEKKTHWTSKAPSYYSEQKKKSPKRSELCVGGSNYGASAAGAVTDINSINDSVNNISNNSG